jgi:hypothetical protein
MLVHTKGKQVPTFANYSLIQSFRRLNHLRPFMLKSRKTYHKGKTLDAMTLPLGKPMKKHFTPDLTPTYVDKLSKPKRAIPQVYQSVGSMIFASMKVFLQLTYLRLM